MLKVLFNKFYTSKAAAWEGEETGQGRQEIQLGQGSRQGHSSNIPAQLALGSCVGRVQVGAGDAMEGGTISLGTSSSSCSPQNTKPNLPQKQGHLHQPQGQSEHPALIWQGQGLRSPCPHVSCLCANEPHPHQGRPLLPDSEGHADKWTSAAAR